MALGKQLIIDLYECDVSKFNRESIKNWLDGLCKLIDMEQEDLYFWDYEDVPEEKRPTEVHLLGTSAVQFITTSNIVIHTLELLKGCCIDIFSCKDYDHMLALDFTKDWFGSKRYEYRTIIRGKHLKCDNIKTKDCFDCESHGKCSGPGWEQNPCFRKEDNEKENGKKEEKSN